MLEQTPVFEKSAAAACPAEACEPFLADNGNLGRRYPFHASRGMLLGGTYGGILRSYGRPSSFGNLS